MVAVLQRASKGQHAEETADRLIEAAKHSLAVGIAGGAQVAEVEVWVDLVQRYAEHTALVKAQLKTALSRLPQTAALATFPGSGTLTIGAVLGTLGDCRRYESVQQVLAVAGLSLVERSSGEHTGKKRISKRGRPMLRTLVFLLALRHIKQDGLFRARYLELRKRNGDLHKPALVAVARSILKVLFALARSGEPFDLDRVGSPYAVPR